MFKPNCPPKQMNSLFHAETMRKCHRLKKVFVLVQLCIVRYTPPNPPLPTLTPASSSLHTILPRPYQGSIIKTILHVFMTLFIVISLSFLLPSLSLYHTLSEDLLLSQT